MSARKSTQMHTPDPIIIPELEEAMANFKPRCGWTENEIAILKRYYGKVPMSALSAQLHRSIDSIHKYAQMHGIRGNQKK